MTYKLTRDELETTINYTAADDYASVITHDAALIRKLRKAGAQEISANRDFGYECVQFIVPKKYVKISPPRVSNDTPEQKAAKAERMRLARLRRSENQQ